MSESERLERCGEAVFCFDDEKEERGRVTSLLKSWAR